MNYNYIHPRDSEDVVFVCARARGARACVTIHDISLTFC